MKGRIGDSRIVKKYRRVYPANGWPRRLVRDLAAGMVALRLATAKPRFRVQAPKTSAPPRGIPAIGNKVLLSLEECDECNSVAAEYETDFAAFTLAERTMGQVHGKSGVPSVKSNDRLSRIDMGSDGFEIGQVLGGQELFKFDELRPGATAAVPLPGFRPQGVYKAMVKMALSVIPRSELDPFADVLKWISNRGMLKDIGYAAASWHTLLCSPSAPMRQTEGLHGGRISGSS